MSDVFCSIRNAEVISIHRIPSVAWDDFEKSVTESLKRGWRASAFFVVPAENAQLRLFACLCDDEPNGYVHVSSTSISSSFKSLTPSCTELHWFEREICEEHGLVAEGHPWLKPIRFNQENSMPGVTEYFAVTGEETHEVGVGPVHAGIIEPGHFRFQCHGENVLHLEIGLGYQHRGIEKRLKGGPDKRTLYTMQTVAGDSSVAHALAYCQMVEALGGLSVSAEADLVRALALELERLANHTGDLGALANDVGYLPTAAFCGRIRGDFLNMTAVLSGNRFGRGLCAVGGLGIDVTERDREKILSSLKTAGNDIESAVELLWATSSVSARFEKAGCLTGDVARELGLVGVAARACGLKRDIRVTHPFGLYRQYQLGLATYSSGDVYARAMVRWLEIRESLGYLSERLGGGMSIECGSVGLNRIPPLAADAFVVSMTEGWRGEVCHVGITDDKGRFSHYKIVDPSFHNWFGLAMALRDQPISDFPLCNKSFNLSYCGHDL